MSVRLDLVKYATDFVRVSTIPKLEDYLLQVYMFIHICKYIHTIHYTCKLYLWIKHSTRVYLGWVFSIILDVSNANDIMFFYSCYVIGGKRADDVAHEHWISNRCGASYLKWRLRNRKRAGYQEGHCAWDRSHTQRNATIIVDRCFSDMWEISTTGGSIFKFCDLLILRTNKLTLYTGVIRVATE